MFRRNLAIDLREECLRTISLLCASMNLSLPATAGGELHDVSDDESLLQDAARARVVVREGNRAGDWPYTCSGEGADGIDLRQRPTAGALPVRRSSRATRHDGVVHRLACRYKEWPNYDRWP